MYTASVRACIRFKLPLQFIFHASLGHMHTRTHAHTEDRMMHVCWARTLASGARETRQARTTQIPKHITCPQKNCIILIITIMLEFVHGPSYGEFNVHVCGCVYVRARVCNYSPGVMLGPAHTRHILYGFAVMRDGRALSLHAPRVHCGDYGANAVSNKQTCVLCACLMRHEHARTHVRNARSSI